MQELYANVKVLEYKLNRLRDHIESRLSALEGGPTEVELRVLLNMIKEFEVVPAGWQLTKPLVDPVTCEKYVKNLKERCEHDER